jgi:cellobiose phosphorylase
MGIRLNPVKRWRLLLDESSPPQKDEPPLRDELFSVDQLDRHARSVAAAHKLRPDLRRRGTDRLLPRLEETEHTLEQAYGLITDAVGRGRRVTPAAEWFLDNYHLIEEQIRTARRDLPPGYSRQLPELSTGAWEGYPRVYAIALELISHVDGRIDADSLRAFVIAYQSEGPLRLGELWAIPIMLRLALLENLRRVVVRVAAGRRDRERATYWIERMLATAAKAPGQVVLVLADMVKENPPLSTAFVTEFATRAQSGGSALVFPLSWLEQRVVEQGQTVQGIFQETSQVQAADQVSVGNSIGSLRFLGATEWRDFVEAMSSVERILRADPAGVYAAMDFTTRDRYRHAVEDIARRCRHSEEDVARQAVSLAQNSPVTDQSQNHVGYSLIGPGLPAFERWAQTRFSLNRILLRFIERFPLACYAGSILLLTVAITGMIARYAAHHGLTSWRLDVWCILLLPCATQLAVTLINWLAMLLLRPVILPRMDFSNGIPAKQRTLVAVPAMLSNDLDIDGLVEALEVRFLANRDDNLRFALVTDFPDADTETLPGDEAMRQRARHGIEALNSKYPIAGGSFFLFHRARRWNPKENVWMGWERKRGKLEDLNRALRGEPGRFAWVVGPANDLATIRFVITLDSDTHLPRGSARLLAAAMSHPLNRPHYCPTLKRVTRGYAILQPRVGICVPSANRSRFARLFAGEPGVDPYTQAVSDVYQDLFDEGSFIGKGIYDVDVFHQAIGGQLPENRVLSHDLLEGGYARSGLISDVILFEDYPASYLADMSRRRRWIRGDWQIAPWLLPRVPAANGSWVKNPISLLSQWKLLDNIRRSVMPVALLSLLIFTWLLHGIALTGTLCVMGILFLPAVLNAAMELTRRPTDLPLLQHLRMVAHSVLRQVLHQGVALVCLPFEALASAKAIFLTLNRMVFTGRRLLEWRTASDAQRNAVSSLRGFYFSMWVAPMLALVILTTGVLHWIALPVAGPILALWFFSPAIAFWLSRENQTVAPHLAESDLAFLGILSRRTWRFFETFVTRGDNFLPPDSFQEDPPVGSAHRTSPTNIGMALLANLAAYDFGYISVARVIERTTQTLDTLDKLHRHRGHFYNWYDTQSLEPLLPLYISTVDSGNLAGHLLTLAAGLEGLNTEQIYRPVIFAGLGSTLDCLLELLRARDAGSLKNLRESLRLPPPSLREGIALLKQIAEEAARLTLAAGPNAAKDVNWWFDAVANQCREISFELTELLPWSNAASHGDASYSPANVRTLTDVARMESTLLPAMPGNGIDDRLEQLRAPIMASSEIAARRIAELRRLGIRCRELADVDYAFLYDKSRHLLSIGYSVADHRRDTGFYDLLASEARLASYIAIAQEKLPGEHWFNLGRSLTNTGGGMALLSWSGSMFEYLMPLLVMPTYEHTLLDETYHSVVKRQISYGRERGVPWGISESGYTKTDAQGNYQYQAFGVPGLGFKRGLANDLVIAPYATAMALMVDPQAACANLQQLAKDGRFSTYGFYEAVDYSPARLRRGQESATVLSYMAHHQGMAFLSLAYLLCDRPMQKRFDSDPAFRATDLLLQERIPKATAIFPHPAEVLRAQSLSEVPPNFRLFHTAHTAVPEVHLLSNGRYHVTVTAAGGGYSRWRDAAITRWREDATRDCWGTFIYLRDVASGEFWSAAQQPTTKLPDTYEAVYSQGRAEYRRTDGEIETHLEISVSPEDDIELRRVSITNRGRLPRTIELTTYAEVVLVPAAADAAHPAFSNLFVETQIVRDRQAILCTRRPRAASETPPWMLHLMTVYGAAVASTSYETSRDAFIGRGRTLADPAAMHRELLTDSEGAVLDPIVSIRNTMVIHPDQTVRVHIVTGVSETRVGATALAEKYYDQHLADRVFELAWTRSQVMLRQLDAAESDTQLFGRLASSILYTNRSLRAPASVIARNHRGQSGLWAYGISGDLPIVLLRVGESSNMNLVRQLVQAHVYWRAHGLAVDLVIWNEDQSGYRQVVNEQITEAIASRGEINLLDKSGGIFIRRLEQISDEDKILMQTVARIVVSDSGGTLLEQMERQATPELPVPELRVLRGPRTQTASEVPAHDLALFNGIGGFTHDGREYVISTTPDAPTPAPWCNVLANPWFGTVVSESGGAYTWCENAHSFRLTPWNNDAVSDLNGEAFYIRNEETGRFWSPTPLPARGPMPYTTRHGFGYSVFEYTADGITTEMRVFVACDAPVKFATIRFSNKSGYARQLSATAYFELVLGDRRETHAPHVVTQIDPKSGALLAHNAYNTDFGERFVFLDSSESIRTVTGDRGEFLGRNGQPSDPACMTRARLSGRTGAAMDPCAAMQIMIDLADGQEREIAFTFGTGRDLADTRNLVTRFRGMGAARTALQAVNEFWNRTLGVVHVETPDASVNFLTNGWLLYQVMASRVFGRSGFYQSGGAFGFRDQLQDAMALVHAQPALLREQILRCAAHQFREGDVLHWWHPPAGRGVRTKISDDYLWLPLAVCRYVTALGDTGVLDERIAFIDGRPLRSDEDSNYDLPTQSAESAPLYEHCVRAIKHGLTFGVHGLPLMGCGDWNDGMNLVGEAGKGESVWLAFFLYDVLNEFEALATRRQDQAIASLCQSEAQKLRENIEAHAWDGDWYRRAYFDSGEPLGSASNVECQIDSIPQSWSVLSKAADPARAQRGMAAVDRQLVRRDIGIIQLFEPPFDKSNLNPGYVKGYVPGVRENGGQYTHAAIWAVMAFAASGDAARAWELFGLINPLNHSSTEAAIGKYKVEPYVVAADVYANPQHAGRGGWTWYTGSAGWMYRLITESFMGLHLQVDRLRFAPCMPPDWKAFKIHYRYQGTFYHITVTNTGTGTGKIVKRIVSDGADQPGDTLMMSDDRKAHHVDVEIA